MIKILPNKKYILFVSFILTLIVLRLLLPLIVKHYVVEALNRDPHYRGSVEGIDVHLWRGAYTIEDLKIEKVEGQKTYPLIQARTIDIGLNWKEIFHGAIVAEVEIERAKINLVLEKVSSEKKQIEIGGESKKEKTEEVHTWQQTVNELVPLKIGRMAVNDSEFHFHDLTSNPKFDLFLDRLHADAYNLTNSRKVAKSLFATIFVNCRAMKSGQLELKTYLDPLSTPPDFKLELKLTGLELVELNKLFTAYGKFDVKKGKFDLYSELATAHNKITGYFKPIIKDLQVADFSKDREKGLGHALWEEMVAAIGGILKNFPKDQQAAKIPIEGRLDSPHTELWPMITSILHNMFVEAIKPKLDGGVNLKDLNSKKK